MSSPQQSETRTLTLDLTPASLMQGSSLYVPPPQPQHTKMAALRRDLQDQADRQAYSRMVASAAPSGGQQRLLLKNKHFSPGTLVYSKQDALAREDWDQTRREVSALLNVLVSMFAVAFAVWWLFANHTPAQVHLRFSPSVHFSVV